jgi:hypothetical protein
MVISVISDVWEECIEMRQIIGLYSSIRFLLRRWLWGMWRGKAVEPLDK